MAAPATTPSSPIEDTIDGGEGDDLIQVWSDQAYVLQGGTGTDTVSLASGSWIIGTSFSLAGNGIEIIQGNGGYLRGGVSNDILDFSGITLNSVAYIDGEGGNDTISGFAAAADVRGGTGEDSLTGGVGHDTLSGGSGNDTLSGGSGNDILDINTTAAQGNDLLQGGAGNDTLFAYQGDTIDGGEGDDLIQVWSDQAYVLQGGTGTDTVSLASSYWFTGDSFSLATNGIEIIQGNGGYLRGGVSNDTLNFTGITLNSVAYIDGEGGNDTIGGFAAADVRGGTGEDSLTGGVDNDTLSGGSGNDTLSGGSGNDILDINTTAAQGNDLLQGGAGNDTLFAYQGDTIDGGSGNDLIQVWSDQVYSLQGGIGTDTVSIASSYWYSGAFSLAANGIEIINGNGVGIYGTVSNEVIDFTGITLNQVAFVDGQGGNDTISGFAAAAAVAGGVGEDSLVGSIGNDTLRGESGNDTLVGGDGNDILDINTTAAQGNDLLQGGAGNDTLFAYQGDTIDGGSGNDLIQVWSDQVYSLQGGVGTDTVSIASSYWYSGAFSLAANGIEIINGNGVGIYGTVSNEVIDFTGITLDQVAFVDGQGGNDTISGFAAAAAVAGGVGEDSLVGSIGNDTLRGESGNDTLVGGDGNDILDINTTAAQGNDLLQGGAGNDTLFAYQGDTIDGGTGDDLIQVWSDQVYALQGGAGTDTLSIASSYWYSGAFSLAANGIEIINGNGVGIYGTASNEVMDFNGITLNQVAFVDGQGGNDTISGFAAAASVIGGVGEDSLVGSIGNDTLRGDSGNDTLIGGSGNDLIDISTSYAGGNDLLQGGAGNDTLFAYQGDTIDGGTGNDLISVWSDQIYSLQGGTGTDTVAIASSYWFIGNSFSQAANGIEIIDGNGEEIYATAGNDTIDFTGITLNSVLFIDAQGGNDTLTGSAGADDLRGLAGNDSLIGGAGDDTLNGGVDTDSFDGGAGNDTIDYSFTGTGGSITLPSGVSTIGGVNETFTSIESVIGSQGNDTITGSGGANRLDGQNGNDSIVGGDGDDTISGGAGTDTLDGGNGNDTVDFTFLGVSSPVDINLVTQVATFTSSVEAILSFENAIGGSGNDTITGTAGANRLDGFGGNDSILGGDGNDTLSGGLGTDVLNGEGGVNTVDYSYALGGIIDLAAGTANFGGTDVDTLMGFERIIGSEGRDTITGSADADYIDAARSNDSVLGGNGNDTILGGVGRDTLEGEGGNDSILGGNGDDSLTGGAGNDTLNGQAGIDTLVGGAGNDRYIYDGSADSFVELAGQGTDQVNASASFSLTIGDNIENVVLTGSAAINATGNELNNKLTGNGGANVLSGLTGNDTLIGNNGNDTLIGGAGNDSLNGGTGTDTASYEDAAAAVTVSLAVAGAQDTGGAGTDTLTQLENLTGSDFNDTLTGNNGVNVLRGGAGNDVLNGGSGADTLLGEAGNDTLNGQAGNDSLAGGPGDDVYLYDGTADTFVELAGQGTDRVESSVTYTLAAGNNIEDLTLTGAAADGTGNELGNLITGNAGANTLSGLDGNDTLIGGTGDDTLDGGAGSDTASYADAASAVNADLGTGAVSGGAGNDTLTVIEHLIGSGFNDQLTGSTAANLLNGGAGNDSLFGGNGADTLIGGGGNDSMNGQGGVDSLAGGLGNDIYTFDGTADLFVELAGEGTDRVNASASYILGAGNNIENVTLTGTAADATGNELNNQLVGNASANTLSGLAGNDTLTGGGGADAFKFITAGEGVDSITDFDNTTSDQIQVVSANFGGLPLGPLNPSRFLAPGDPLPANAVFIYNGITGALSFDSNGSGAGGNTQIATLTGPKALVASDILVVAA